MRSALDGLGDLDGFESHLDVGSVQELSPDGEEQTTLTGGTFEVRASRAMYRFALGCWAIDRMRLEPERADYWRDLGRHFAQHFQDASQVVYITGRLLNRTYRPQSFLFWWLVDGEGESGARRDLIGFTLRGFVALVETKIGSPESGVPVFPAESWIESQHAGLISALGNAPSLYDGGDRREDLRIAVDRARDHAAEERLEAIRRTPLDPPRVAEFEAAAEREFSALPRLADLLAWRRRRPTEDDLTNMRIEFEESLEKASFVPVRGIGWAAFQGEAFARDAVEAEDSHLRAQLDFASIVEGAGDVVRGVSQARQSMAESGHESNLLLVPLAPNLISALVERPPNLVAIRGELVASGLRPEWSEAYLGLADEMPCFRLRGLAQAIVLDVDSAVVISGTQDDANVQIGLRARSREEALEIARGRPDKGTVEEQVLQLLDSVEASITFSPRASVDVVEAIRRVSLSD